MIRVFLNNDPCGLVACISLWQTLTTLLSWCLIIHQLLVNQFSAVPNFAILFLITGRYHILPAKLWQWNFRRTVLVECMSYWDMGHFPACHVRAFLESIMVIPLKTCPEIKTSKNSQALYACTNKHGVLAKPPPGLVLFLKPIFTPSFLSAKREFFKHTVYATTFVTNMAAKRWKIAANPHYQTPAFCLLQVSPSSNSVKFSVLLQCLDIFTQLAADRILNKKKQIPMKLPIFPNRAANGWTLGCCFLLLDVL